MTAWLRPADQVAGTLTVNHTKIIVPIGGQFRLEEAGGVGEVNGWGTIGMFDDTNTQDLGDHTATTLNRLAGGMSFSYPVNFKRIYAWHRTSAAAAQPWGWVVYHQQKTDASNAETTTFILHESQENANVGTRNYGNTTTRLVDLDLSARTEAQNIPAGNVIGLAVSAPTADPGLFNVQIMGGHFELEVA